MILNVVRVRVQPHDAAEVRDYSHLHEHGHDTNL